MFYDTKLNNHGLKYNPFKACIVPRPIGWISSLSKENIVNIAPYSYFNAVSDIPPTVMFASGYKENNDLKDSIRNIEDTHEFVVNMATYSNKDLMQLSSTNLPHNVSEAEYFNIELSNSKIVKPPRVKNSPVALECKLVKTIDIEVDEEKASSKMVIGHVVGIYIDDSIIEDGKVDISTSKIIARLGYDEYATITEIFKMNRK